MTMMACTHCGATTSNGLVLCDLCQHQAATWFEFLPIYFRNLARWRPGRAGSRPVPGSTVLYYGEATKVGTGDRISDALDEAVTSLTTWARSFADDRALFERPLTLVNAVLTQDLPDELAEELSDAQPKMVALLCAGLGHHLVSVATLEWAGEMVRDLGKHEVRLRQLTETSVPGWYAGECRRRVTMEATCSAPTYVVPGLTWVTCQRCGNTSHAGDHLETILSEARGWAGSPTSVAAAIVALIDTEMSVPNLHDRIRQWSARGDLKPVQRLERQHVYSLKTEQFVIADQPVGPKRYRMGEVLDLVLRDTRRIKRTVVVTEVS